MYSLFNVDGCIWIGRGPGWGGVEWSGVGWAGGGSKRDPDKRRGAGWAGA